MGRPKGSKNKKEEIPAPLKEKGNPLFKLQDAQSVEPNWASDVASSVATAEDMAFDRELEHMARNNEPQVSDQEPVQLKKTVDAYTLLSEFEDDYKPARTIHELDDQVFRAKQFEADSIEASEQIVKHFTKSCWKETQKVGYFTYHDIKVYITGFFEQSKMRDTQTIEQKVFGVPKPA